MKYVVLFLINTEHRNSRPSERSYPFMDADRSKLEDFGKTGVKEASLV
jgi:hypothetical protein